LRIRFRQNPSRARSCSQDTLHLLLARPAHSL
jgi:hypothetical protein